MIGSSLNTQRGFTLIEMSIVLIIIGLIIGGILKGQELIESARQKNFISQLDSIKAGTNSFIDRFRGFPGDTARTVFTGYVAGNDDGILNTAVTDAATLASSTLGTTGENMQFFNHLVGGGFIGGGSRTDQTSVTNYAGGAALSPLPAAAFPQSGLSIVYATHQGGNGAGSLLANWIRVSRFGTNTAMASATAVIAPSRMAQLDLKYDDGLPDTGRIRTISTIAVTAGDCGNVAATTGAYNAAINSVGCHIIMSLE